MSDLGEEAMRDDRIAAGSAGEWLEAFPCGINRRQIEKSEENETMHQAADKPIAVNIIPEPL